mgnify:CR=1 FL=1
MSFIPQRALTKAETLALASIPDLPAAALAILAETAESKPASAPREIGREPAEWQGAVWHAIDMYRNAHVDFRWGREMRNVRIPAAWTLYRDRTGKVRAGNRERLVPEPWAFPGGKYPKGVVDLGSARRA